jgi:hypothetical protein
MERVIKQQGRYTLFHIEQGFAWIMTGESGTRWYWHPETGQWTGHPHACRTAEEATAGLDSDGPHMDDSCLTPVRAPLCRHEGLRRR